MQELTNRRVQSSMSKRRSLDDGRDVFGFYKLRLEEERVSTLSRGSLSGCRSEGDVFSVLGVLVSWGLWIDME